MDGGLATADMAGVAHAGFPLVTGKLTQGGQWQGQNSEQSSVHCIASASDPATRRPAEGLLATGPLAGGSQAAVASEKSF